MGWDKGDRLLVEVLGDDMIVLIRRPESWTEAFAGKMSDVFGDHETTMRWLEEELQAWQHWDEEHQETDR